MLRMAFLIVTSVLIIALLPSPSGATQAYGSDGWSVPKSGGPSPSIVSCSTRGNTTTVTTKGRAKFTVDNLRIVAGRQNDLDNVVMAERFINTRKAAGSPRVKSCRVRTLHGVLRAVVVTKSGARWALVGPRVGRYFMTFA